MLAALRPALRLWPLLFLIASIGSWVASLQAQTAPANPILVLKIDGIIGPASADFFSRTLARAQSRGARLLVLQMDTPGGLDESMRRMIKDILASPVPVATFVAPEGARAASAGTYILYASHIAAMAPATNLGAATPVAIGAPGGEEPERKPAKPERTEDDADKKGDQRAAPSSAESMREKAINDAAAYIRGLAQLRGRNAEFAEQAVRKASSLSADEALKGGVIDLIAVDVKDLLKQIDGRTVTLPAGKAVLALASAPVETLEPDWRTKALAVLSNPMLAMVLMMIGIYGLFVEFTSPGFGVPGIAGAISLLLALYAFHMLPVNWAGVALLVLGLVLMISELFFPTFGALGIGGFIAFVIGGLMLFDAEHPVIDVGWPFVVGLGLAGAAAIFAFGALALKARNRPVVAGREEMVGAAGVVTEIDDSFAWAQVRGERWRVRSVVPLAVGDRIRVTGIDGLTLDVNTDTPRGN
jgi:membrane-bound serine protease (ClpP class)